MCAPGSGSELCNRGCCFLITLVDAKVETVVTQPDTDRGPEDESLKWALLSYRMPREPSTPRIAVWRRLKTLGVVQIGDGLVALPLDARTKEHLEWVSAQVVEANGQAIVWSASAVAKRDNRHLAAKMNDERDEEYGALIAEVTAITDSDEEPVAKRTLGRLRREYRRIERRDYFRSPLREEARQAIVTLTALTGATTPAPASGASP